MPISGKTGLAWRRRPLPYTTDADIAAIDVPALCAADAWVLLWCPATVIGRALAVLGGWARFSGVRVWRKNGGPQLPGQWQSNAEFVLVGRRGSPRWSSTQGFAAVFDGARPRATGPCACEREARANVCASCPPRFLHSAKPEEFYRDLAGRTDGPRLDMFARRAHPGFVAWGAQAPSP